MKEKDPYLPDQLQDPKLPVIHSRTPGNGLQQRRTDGPVPAAPELL